MPKIEEKPTLREYEGLKKAINDNKLAIFIGAGASRLISDSNGSRCLGWDELAKNLLAKCLTVKKKNNDSTCINHKEYTTLLRVQGHKKLITICNGILLENNHKEIFRNEMEKALLFVKNETDNDYYKRIKSPNIYDTIKRIGRMFVTTNADTHFASKRKDRFVESNIFFREEDFKKDNIRENAIYQIHGSIEDFDNIIFTEKGYIQRYRNKDFSDFIEEIFNRYTVLFIGYGLTEVELLRSIFPMSSKKREEGDFAIKHYALKGYYKDEANLMEYEQHFYSSNKIELIGFAKDEIGYDQLFVVLQEWEKEIISETRYQDHGIKLIDNFARASWN